MIPNRSTTVICLAPAAKNLRVMDSPADPPPLTTILTSAKVLLINFKLLNKADKTTIAVPCWSS